MPLRGTTHARHMKRVLIRESAQEGQRILCAWDDCDRPGYDNYRVRVRELKKSVGEGYINYVFCCENHKRYFVNSHRRYGYLEAY